MAGYPDVFVDDINARLDLLEKSRSAGVNIGHAAVKTVHDIIPGTQLVHKLASSAGVSFDSAEFAQQMDAQDELGEFREQFHFPTTPDTAVTRIPGSRSVYLCGNSLGLQPKNTAGYVNEELVKWQKLGVEGHFPDVNPVHPWVTADEDCREDMSKIVGCNVSEVAIMNSLTVNLHLLMCAFYRPTRTRHKILMEAKAFPSDKFALASQTSFHGFNPEESLIEMVPREGEHWLRTEDIEAIIAEHGDSIAVVCFSGVQYYTGQLFDIERITAAAHAKGCIAGWDLAHAAGNAPLKLHDWGCDFACWCSYKYLNSGPGGISAVFVHDDVANDPELTKLLGWWGHRKEDRFVMEHKFTESTGAQSFMLSNPPVLCIAALRASTELFMQAGMGRLRTKSVQLTSYLEALIESQLGKHVTLITPRELSDRGASLSLVFNEPVDEVHRKIALEGIICDVRKPVVMRIAPTPMYNSFEDVYEFVKTLKAVLEK